MYVHVHIIEKGCLRCHCVVFSLTLYIHVHRNMYIVYTYCIWYIHVHVHVCLSQAVGQMRGDEGREGGRRDEEKGGGASEDWGMGHICSALSNSLSLWRHISKKFSPGHTPLSIHLSHVCHVTVALAQCLCRVLVYCVDTCSGGGSSLVCVVREMVMVGVVMLAVPRLHSKLCSFLEILDPSNYQVCECVSLCVCVLKATFCRFLKRSRSSSSHFETFRRV